MTLDQLLQKPWFKDGSVFPLDLLGGMRARCDIACAYAYCMEFCPTGSFPKFHLHTDERSDTDGSVVTTISIEGVDVEYVACVSRPKRITRKAVVEQHDRMVSKELLSALRGMVEGLCNREDNPDAVRIGGQLAESLRRFEGAEGGFVLT